MLLFLCVAMAVLSAHAAVRRAGGASGGMGRHNHRAACGAGAHACVAMRVVCVVKVCECAFVRVVRCGCALRGGERHAREPRWQ